MKKFTFLSSTVSLNSLFVLIFLKLTVDARKVRFEVKDENITVKRYFPNGFLLGAASSAYQIEGAWNSSGKGESIWDRMVHDHPYKIKEMANGDVAMNSYNMYKTDIELIKQINGNAYRISISWPRIMPTGFDNNINTEGIEHYNNVINEMLKQNITPLVTMYHWDLPQPLQELGGWTNPLIESWFVDYARVLFTAFGDRVKYWLTINEPIAMCYFGYNGEFAPAINQSGIGDYLCGHHALIAHASVYHMYKKEFYREQNGKIGIAHILTWQTPRNENDPEEVTGVKLSWEFWNSWFLHPIFSLDGDYPPTMKHRISALSTIQGFSRSRLPRLSKRQIDMIIGTADYVGINFYNAVSSKKLNYSNPKKSISFDEDTKMQSAFKTPTINRCTPVEMSKAIKYMMKRYPEIPSIMITENGFEDDGEIIDIGRAQVFHNYLYEILKLISEGVNIQGYLAWSLTDNFEWSRGYTKRFGIFSVNFTDPLLPRTPKLSTKVLSRIYKDKTVDNPFIIEI